MSCSCRSRHSRHCCQSAIQLVLRPSSHLPQGIFEDLKKIYIKNVKKYIIYIFLPVGVQGLIATKALALVIVA